MYYLRPGRMWIARRRRWHTGLALLLSTALALSLAPVSAQQDNGTATDDAGARIDQAMAHLSQYLGETISRDQHVHYWEALTWPDASLGCPIAGRVYAETPTAGYRIQITVNGVDYIYHTSGDGTAMVLCINGSPDPSTVGTNWWRLAPDLEPDPTVTIASWDLDNEPQAFADSLARFEALFPNIDVVHEPVADGDYDEAMKRLMAAGRAPDVVYITPGLMSVFSPYGLLMPLDDYLQVVGLSRGDYAPASIEMFTYERKTYALPIETDSLGLVYLPQLFEEAGVAYPHAGWTWEDMTNTARAISEVTGVYGMCTPADEARWLAALYQAGGEVTDADYTEAQFNSPEAVRALEFWYGMYVDGYGAPPMALNVANCAEALGRGLVAMAWENISIVDYMAQSYPDVAYAIAPLPVGPAGPANLTFSEGVGVNAAAKNPVAAALLAMYLASPENGEALLHDYAILPAQRALLDDPWFDAHPNEAAIAEGAATGRPFYFGHSFFFGLEHRYVLAWIQDALNAVFRGERDIQQALDAAVSALN